MAKPNKYRDRIKQAGFTLVEISISLIILGLMIAPLIVLYGQYLKEKQMTTTVERTTAAYRALQNFAELNATYPCPAPLTTARGAAGNGAEGRASPTAPCPAVAGVFTSTNTDTTIDPASSGGILIGALPFRALQIEEKDTFDAYGGRLLYVVSQDVTTSNATTTPGAISIVDENGNENAGINSGITGNTQFLVLSHGANNYGAYNSGGIPIVPCPAASRDRENCDNNFTFRAQLQATAVGATEFDDFVVSHGRYVNEPWDFVNIGGVDTRDIYTPSDVKIGENNAPTAELDIISGDDPFNSMLIEGGGRLLVDSIESSLHTGGGTPPSFSPNEISDFTCPPNEFLIGIKDKGPLCDNTLDLRCPNNQQLLGLTSSGDLQCADPMFNSCPAFPNIMGECQSGGPSGTYPGNEPNDGLPDTPHGGIFTVTLDSPASAGNQSCRRAVFTCDDGAWDPDPATLLPTDSAWTGECNFAPFTEIRQYAVCEGSATTYATQWIVNCDGVDTYDFVLPGTLPATGCDCGNDFAASEEPCSNFPGYENTTGTVVTYTPASGWGCSSGTPENPIFNCNCTPPSDYASPTPPDKYDTYSVPAPCPGDAEPIGGGVREKTYTYNTATCAWVETFNKDCDCTLTPKDYARTPACNENLCEVPGNNDLFVGIVDVVSTDTECRYETNAEVEAKIIANGLTPTTAGTCGLPTFYLEGLTDGHEVLTSSPPLGGNNKVGDSSTSPAGCNCSTTKDGSRFPCWEPSSGAYRRGQCRCVAR